jgi:cytochrome c-type biogenesis protein CcmH
MTAPPSQIREVFPAIGSTQGGSVLVFWIVAAMFLAGALLLMLPVLLRARPADAVNPRDAALTVHRDQWQEAETDVAAGRLDAQQLAAARAEIDRRAREDVATADDSRTLARPARRTAVALALLVPAASVSLYLLLGDPQASTPAATAAQSHSTSPEQVNKMVAALAERLKAQPDDVDGWTMLGRSYVALGRYRDAATALQRANALSPANPGLLADLADVTGMTQDRKLAGEPSRLIQQALDIDPKHVKALALAGTAAFDAQDYEGARGFWQRLLAVVPADSPLARSVQSSIEQAQQAGVGGAAAVPTTATRTVQAKPNEAAVTPTPAPTPAASGPSVSGQVVVSAELAARIAPGDTLFIFARAAQGPRMPLAIIKRPAALPSGFTLDDTMAMSPAMRLSGASEVVVGARISKSGNATPQSGDLIGQSAPVRLGTKDLRVVLDATQP